VALNASKSRSGVYISARSEFSREIYFQKRKTNNRLQPIIRTKMRLKMDAEKSSVSQAMEGRPVASWASIFLDYFDLKARLLAVESRELTGHFIGLLLLFAVMLV
jgi:hypothetical protein